MDTVYHRISIALFAAGLCLLLSGCAPKNFRTNPELAAKSQGIKTVAFAPPDIKIYEISAGGVPELRDEWSEQGRDNVAKAIISRFNGSPLEVRPYRPDDDTAREYREILALFEAVSQSIILHTFSGNNNPNIFPDKVNNFDYSVGSLELLLKKSEGDGLLIVSGEDEIATSGKKVLNALGIVTGLAVGAFTGLAVMPKVEGARVRAAFIDRHGTILWYNIVGSSTNDLRIPESSADILTTTLEGFPGLGK